MTDSDYRLHIQSGPAAGRVYDLTGGSITIGRYPLAEIVIDDPEISYRHAVLTRVGQTYKIADLASDGGTYVNGRRVGVEPVTLSPGDIILFGSRLSAAFLAIVDEGLIIEPEPQTDPTPSPEPTNTTFPVESMMEQPPVDPPQFESEYEPPPWEDNDVERRSPEAVQTEEVLQTAHPEPLPSPPPPHKNNGRIILITAGCLILLLACCCSATAFMYFIGGDWLLNQLGYLP